MKLFHLFLSFFMCQNGRIGIVYNINKRNTKNLLKGGSIVDFNSILNGLLAGDENSALKMPASPVGFFGGNWIIWIILLIILCCCCNDEQGFDDCCCRRRHHRRRRRSRCRCKSQCGCGNGFGLGSGFCDDNFIFLIAIVALIFCSCNRHRFLPTNSVLNLDADSLRTEVEE